MTFRATLFAAASVATLWASTAVAQTASGEVEELVVTGTRTEGRSRLESLAPVDVINEEALRNTGTTELGAALASVAPSLDFPRPAITDGTDSVRPATLRGLAPDQTLVLLNGMRRHASALVNVNGSIGRGSAAVDLNAIPTIAVDRIEVLRDGASAQYGSDAIAGVINMRLREAREGGSVAYTYGYYNTEVKPARIPNGYDKKDGVSNTVQGWVGLPLGAEGFLTLSGEYRHQNPTSRGDLDPRPAVPSITSRYGDPQSENYTFYANAGTPLDDVWSLYGFGGYQNRQTDSAANPRLANNANNVPSIFPNGFLPRITTDIDDFTAAFGTRGEAGGFSIDAGVVYGYNKVHYGVIDSVNASLGASSPTTFDAGAMRYDQWVAGVDLTRPMEFGFAEPATLAFGAEYRHEGYGITAGDVASYTLGPVAGKAAGAQGFPGFKPSNEVDVNRHSYAAYVDLDVPFTEAFGVALAARFEDYSDFGSTLTGKASARYEVTDSLALRGTIASGFRAPALQQQYFTATSTNFISINGVNTPVEVSTFPATSATAAALGAKPLEAEDSINYSLGLVYSVGAFEVTVDAYRIDIDDRIVLSENILGTPTGSATAVAIYNLLNPPGTSGIGGGRFFINGVDTTTKGVDIVARYRLNTDTAGRFDITAAANFNKTEVTKIPTTAPLSALPVPPVLFDRGNRLTFEEGTPDQKHVLAVDWSLGAFGATAKATYYGDVLIPNNNATLDYKAGDHVLVDFEGRYELDMGATLALGVNNLFDEYPNATPPNVNTNGPIGFPSYSPFGFNGRFLYARVGFNW
ncbi:TonB-dependent siderophore receptor [Phenylobacterium sp. J367]|uniref:TonB-dependent receptor plug domain-containing protein n=1 Tax=Phenylobacterium sp. J367 TaxID=2898435 RepID=UPI002150706E|nr:TonB-dependent receptor [Phenylobacterium sp. J367]MCR5880287.1 TonB-dependent receptor [Phenylobacterium sp. J367]